MRRIINWRSTIKSAKLETKKRQRREEEESKKWRLRQTVHLKIKVQNNERGKEGRKRENGEE